MRSQEEKREEEARKSSMMGIPFCPSRHTLHPLYPAFFPSKLTSTDGTTWAPCPLASTLVC